MPDQEFQVLNDRFIAFNKLWSNETLVSKPWSWPLFHYLMYRVITTFHDTTLLVTAARTCCAAKRLENGPPQTFRRTRNLQAWGSDPMRLFRRCSRASAPRKRREGCRGREGYAPHSPKNLRKPTGRGAIRQRRSEGGVQQHEQDGVDGRERGWRWPRLRGGRHCCTTRYYTAICYDIA